MKMFMSCLALTSTLVGCLGQDVATDDDDLDGHADGVRGDGLPFLDVNDVSILYTLGRGATARHTVDRLLRLDDFITPEQFAAALASAHPEVDPSFASANRDDWRVVAIRAEPCARLAPTQPDCNPEIRLVTQSFVDGVTADDQAIHLTFALPPDQASPMVRDLVNLKLTSSVVTNGKPLGIHPALAREGIDGPFAAALRLFVTTYTAKAQLATASVMLTLNGGTWRFAVNLNIEGTLTPIPAPCSPEPTIALVTSSGSLGNLVSAVQPAATCADNVNRIVDSNHRGEGRRAGSFFRLPAAERAAAIDASLRIVNPKVHGLLTTDCVSCHVASRALARVKDRAFVAALDGNPNRFVPAAGLTTTYATDLADAAGAYNVRAFGFQGRKVAYTQATVNASAFVAEQVNAMIRDGLLD
jgi:hypothetical protein